MCIKMNNFLNITFISNMPLKGIISSNLQDELINKKIFAELNFLDYGDITQIAKVQIDAKKQNYIVLWLNFKLLYPDINTKIIFDNKYIEKIGNEVEKKLCKIQKVYSSAKVVIISQDKNIDFGLKTNRFLLPQESFSAKIDKMLKSIFINAVIWDINTILADSSVDYFDFRYLSNFGFPYNKKFIRKFINYFVDEFQFLLENKYKCIIVDADNTLWGGTISENIRNIALGEYGVGFYYKEFQRVLNYLYYQGIILCMCTKNDIDDIDLMFQSREMVLKKEQFAVIKADWNNKVENIENIIKELNIDPNSVIFIDDSIFEVQAINCCIPAVTTFLFSEEKIYDILTYFKFIHKKNIEEIYKRNDVFFTNAQRDILKNKSTSFEQYLKELNTEVSVVAAKESELDRISELSFRTHKYSNGRRYTVETLSSLLQRTAYKLYVVYAKDVFCDFGLVGAVGIEDGVIDLFCLSCRILGRNIEETIFQTIIKNNIINAAICIKNAKNADFYDFLSSKVTVLTE